MAKIDRLERMDTRRAELESEYRAALVAALKVTAAGQWGLFGHNKDKQARAKAAPLVDGLADLADEIDELRDQLDMEPFALHAEFLAARGPVSSHAVGEPRQAQAWLDRLAQEG
ncbi:hypothetical protein [Sphingomonas sp. IC081]|uniref:hypothetical protein n=1 Tax=Sphingomonas sp. IC081 TaxID=304378 RepID=UPI00115AE23A|nr:hypothetical protein [Sphingomonas sp. IC081]QDK34236.1 hypothetical protein DM450_15920 [Sphingomonas sp. IC081]